MKKTGTLLACIVLTTICCAQQPKKIDNPRWKQVVYIKFNEGKYDRAITIIKDYFEKASQKANASMPEAMLRMNSGSWDLMLIWHMKGGVEDLNWEVNPEEAGWMKALGEIAGGETKAKALLEEYLSLIRTSQSEIARVAY